MKSNWFKECEQLMLTELTGCFLMVEDGDRSEDVESTILKKMLN